jgi:hypothetical protein
LDLENHYAIKITKFITYYRARRVALFLFLTIHSEIGDPDAMPAWPKLNFVQANNTLET